MLVFGSQFQNDESRLFCISLSMSMGSLLADVRQQVLTAFLEILVSETLEELNIRKSNACVFRIPKVFCSVTLRELVWVHSWRTSANKF